MANEDAQRSVGDSAQKDISGAVRMGQNTAKAAKTISKAAAEAASGNFIGAAATVLKDPETMKRILILLLIPVLLFAMIGVLFLYALPISIYEVVVSYLEEVSEEWRQQVYEGGGDINFQAILATIRIGGEVVGDFFQGIWTGIKNLFTEDAGGDAGSTIDSVSDSAIELQVTQVEASEKQTLQKKIDACIQKIDSRAEEIEESILKQEDKIASAVAAHFNSKGEYDSFNVQVQVSRNSMSQDGAIQLLSLYTVQRGASLEELKLSDLMRWLGWYDSRNTGKTTFTMNGIGVSCDVKTWNGTFLPQYLVEQRKQEIYMYDVAKTDFESMSCAAVDMLLIVDCPYVDEIPVQQSVVYETTRAPDGQEITTTKTVGTAYVNISIMPRSAASLSNLAGLWTGGLQEEQQGLQFNNGLDTGTSGGGLIIGDPSASGSGSFLWPLPGYTSLSSVFGWRNCPYHGRELHGAVDIPAPAGTPILAADSGTVTISKYNGSLGNYVRINHGNGFETRYCHMTSRAVSVGDVVAQGQVIGYVGTTGSSTGNHLDFAIYSNGNPTDPMGYSYIQP